MDFIVRKMRPQDLPQALAILARWNLEPIEPSAEIPDPERSHIEIAHAFVAEAEGRVIGVASYLMGEAGVAETASLAVDPSCCGRGVGQALQRARLREMRARGVRRVRTESDRPETVDWLVRRFGYRIVGSHPKKHPFSLPQVDRWTVLELDLASAALD